jgi:transcriptional regulator with XRE-family HTH domain
MKNQHLWRSDIFSNDMTIANRIADARTGSGMTIEEAAEFLGVKVATLSKWENGKTTPRADKLPKIAGIYNVSLIWLIEGREDLDPLENMPNDIDEIETSIDRLVGLQNQLSLELDDLRTKVEFLKNRNKTLDQLAEESLPPD